MNDVVPLESMSWCGRNYRSIQPITLTQNNLLLNQAKSVKDDIVSNLGDNQPTKDFNIQENKVC